jgi:hypothetical protein
MLLLRLTISLMGIALALWGVGAFTDGSMTRNVMALSLLLAAGPFIVYVSALRSRLASVSVGSALVGVVLLTQLLHFHYVYLPVFGFVVTLVATPFELRSRLRPS